MKLNKDKWQSAISFGGGLKSKEERKEYDKYVCVDLGKKDSAKNIINADIGVDLNHMGRLPFKDKSFDVVIIRNIAEHLLNIFPLVTEAHRLARKKVIISVPNALSYDNRIGILFGKNLCYPRPFDEMTSHHIYFDEKALNSFCKRFFSEFRIIKKTYYCKGRFATIFKNFISLRPTLFATEIEYEIEK
jgi:hypothetical protein